MPTGKKFDVGEKVLIYQETSRITAVEGKNSDFDPTNSMLFP